MRRLLATLLVLGLGLTGSMQAGFAAVDTATPVEDLIRRSHPSGINPYRSPHFRCAEWLRYGFGSSPSLPLPAADPLCVEYDKRNITADNLGAVVFVWLEPWRFAAAVGKCRYWQIDHWSVQVSRPGDPVLVKWDGSYWFDLVNGEGGGIFRNFRVGGQPSDANTVAALLERVSPEAGAMVRAYGARGGGGGASGHAGNPFGQC